MGGFQCPGIEGVPRKGLNSLFPKLNASTLGLSEPKLVLKVSGCSG